MKLVINDVAVSFGHKNVLQDLSMTLESGGLIGLIGPNGAGKTTLIKVITTLLQPTQGTVLLDGVDIGRHPNVMRQVLGYLPQTVPYYPQLSAKAYLQYVAAIKGLPSKRGDQQIIALLQQLGLADVGKRKLAAFSGGMRQRVAIAATLLGDPKVIIVDEPTTGLDPIERIRLRNLLSSLASDRIVLMATHIISDVEAVANDILLLQAGHLLFQGTALDMMQAAKKQVWEYILPFGQQPRTGAVVSGIIQESDGVHVREIASGKPTADAVLIEPHLEDASMVLLDSQVSQR
ncbi:ABC transporter ATPase [Agrilactobacillus composti DSM 18527 = JCM 14202]|uniref:ABC transporter ATPase n=1 Tax=Agrilactobacillus composti DSM 18527 = JCM 14202 TaxID=1423734 RepID=X0QSZ0_9LACO|nr:ATP-binding cassette domain-containing protein [Agrilactobacillus composti]KRM36104.1 ABC transporter ATPase [Agrilactobacillus composti DSM 18527 = JCM 14202]GAF41730.1 ABC transporter ATP-binding protein [Agrilactobacillus composti DSM 18527 = JCM 14202]